MSEQEPAAYNMTEKGWAISEDIWTRFVFEQEDINAIAASHGMTIEELSILMAMALQGGAIAID